MIVVWGWRRYIQSLAMLTFLCGNCGNPAMHHVKRAYTKFTLFWIPLFVVSSKYFTECTFCGVTHKVPKEEALRLKAQAEQPGMQSPAGPSTPPAGYPQPGYAQSTPPAGYSQPGYAPQQSTPPAGQPQAGYAPQQPMPGGYPQQPMQQQFPQSGGFPQQPQQQPGYAPQQGYPQQGEYPGPRA